MACWDAELMERVQQASRDVGFDVFGVCGAEGNGDRFARWVEAGRAGEMEWLKRRDEAGVLLRSRVEVALPWARSVVVCAMNYNVEGPRSINDADAGAGWIGRYAWSGRRVGEEVLPSDYHYDLLGRLRRVEAALLAERDCEARCYVDTGPVVEREAAVRAGIGWVGKNTCLLREGMGSWMLLGVLVTSLELVEAPVVAADRCGSCTRCLEACPTGALVAPREMDASLCIAYLTIEKKGTISEELREGMGRQVFGCDICQEVCPWNRRAPIGRMVARAEMVNPSLAELGELDAAGFRRLFKGAPLERTGRRRLHRNVAIAMGNSGESRFRGRLEAWAAGEDEMLAGTARWALARLRALLG